MMKGQGHPIQGRLVHCAGGAHAAQSRRFRTSLLIGLCCFVVYNANRRAITAVDTYPARYLPFAILREHTLYLDPVARITAQGRSDGAFWMVPLASGHIISLYPLVVPVLIAPLYLPAAGYLQLRGWTEPRLDQVARVMEKLSASFIAALSAALLYLLLRRHATPRDALLLTMAYAFGTTTWVISSQALWQHGMAQLLVIGALLLLTGPYSAPRAFAAGLLCGLIAANRPPDVILAATLGAYAVFYWAGRRRMVPLAAGAALPVSLLLRYNLGVAHNIAGGYGLRGQSTFFQHNLLQGIGGLLLSPTHGLFVFSPFLLFLVLAWRYLPNDRGERALTGLMGIAIVLQILLYAKTDWRAGISWGPRYLTDLLPLLLWMLVPVVTAMRGAGRIAFTAAVGVAIVIEAIGAFYYTGASDSVVFAQTSPHNMRAAWNWRNAPFIASLKHGRAAAEPLVEVRGSLDVIESGGRETYVVTAGQEVAASGWALMGHATPLQVAITIDGQRTIVTDRFYDRPDVRDALHVTSPAGWRIPFSTAGLAPGDHYVAAYAWAVENGEGRYLYERRLSIADLDADFRKASARIREHQQAPGYWLTAYTSGTRFEDSHPEMNTFLTSLLLELLEPVATSSGLEENVRRARTHLTNQIEHTGLVRYHGLPDAPGIGTIGCVITPDTDDTALVWRLAPAPDRARLTAALATIDGYRTSEGLYRTWLAPLKDYQCLNPGSDPDPADITIQLHLLLLLSEVRPAASQALCEALRPVLDEDRVWVYYRKTPLVPILRVPAVRQAGCALSLPASRMRTDVPGQQIWVDLVRLLGRSTPDEAKKILLDLARDDFFLLRTNPPLLYHNDLTATVSRYYWSEDAGYALWLRLYDEFRHHGSNPGH